jgi:ectoine hydroxylase-related dioxygenase (phytanoyl-CoA dioxygenase family)
MRLTYEQLDFFRRVGYLKLLNRVPPQLLTELTVAVRKDFENPSGKVQQNAEGRTTKIYDLFGRGAPYTALIRLPALLNAMESILGPNVEFSLFRHNHATLNEPGEHPARARLHRDAFQWSHTSASVILYLQDSTISNGCTRLIPGSHFFPFEGTPDKGAGTRLSDHPQWSGFVEQELPVPMPAGGILIFDGGLFHSLGINGSNDTRISVTLSYSAVDELAQARSSGGSVIVRGKYVAGGWRQLP